MPHLKHALFLLGITVLVDVAGCSGPVSSGENTGGTSGTGTGGSGAGAGGAAGTGTGGTSAGGMGSGGTGTGGSGVGGSGVGGTGATGGTAGTAGTAGTGTGGVGGTGATGGTGGSGAIGGGGGDECGAGVTPVSEGRCATMLKVAKGTALTISNFEEPTQNNDYLGIFFADGRAGTWWEAHDAGKGATATMTVEETPAGPPSSTRALHFKGTAPTAGGYGATVGVPLAGCYDASIYQGISFWVKGDPAAGNSAVKVSVHTPASEPESADATKPAGGCSAADDAAMKCHDHFAVRVPLSDQWTRYNVPWSQFAQNCPSNLPAGYGPAAHILEISFSVGDKTQGFDFWVDDVSFDVGTETSEGFADIVSQPTFEEMWMRENMDGTVTDQRNPFYTYDGLVAATQKWGEFCMAGDAVNRRREAAALLANVAHETDSLALLEEKGCEDDKTCSQYGGASPSGQTYHGRGPMQLTWNNNYQDAGGAVGADLINTPELVATDATVSFATAFWFWMVRAGAGSQAPHLGIQTGFGETIRSINGALECGGMNAGAVANRIKHYTRFCYMLGVDPGPNTGC